MSENIASKVSQRLKNLIKNPVTELNFNNLFELLIAVMLSAQCTDKRVNIVTTDLFKKYKTPYDFSVLKDEELEDMIKSCNYYKNKAKNIIKASKMIVEKFNGDVPCTHDELVMLPGVGNKTANVVLAVGFGVQAFPVDTHILRVSNRLGLSKSNNPDKCERDLKSVFKDYDWNEMHHLMLLFGRYHCMAKKPNCTNCPMIDLCKFIDKTRS